MCRTVHAILQALICAVQMLVRVFMTLILMIENIARMFLQTLYNFISFLLQMISLIPICCVFLLTARLKCFICGGGGQCPGNRGGICNCLLSFITIFILFLIFRATGLLDKMFQKLGYSKDNGARLLATPSDLDYLDDESRNVAMPPFLTTKKKKKKKRWEYSDDDTEHISPPPNVLDPPDVNPTKKLPFNWTTVVYYLV